MREIKLLSLNSLIETEEHILKDSQRLAKSMISLGLWTVPIAVDSPTLVIMDGHHRFNAAKLLGLARVPCVMMSYENDDVSLKSWRDDVTCSIKGIRGIVKNSKKYPIKTTRHIFNPSIEEVRIPLGLLY